MNTHRHYFRINYQISAIELRVLDETGKMLGVMSKMDALKKAQQEEKDLVEIGPNAKPPVAKLIDYKKFKYLEAKKEREAKKHVKNVGIKEIRLTPFISDHDFATRIKRGESFLKDGNSLRISIPFRGREITKKEFGYARMNKAALTLKDIAKVVRPAYMEGKVMVMMMSPGK